MIKYLVLSSGGLHSLLYQLGAIKKLIENNKINLNNIEKIYGTSAGAIVGLLLCLNIDIQIIIDYLIKRPWDKIFDLDLNTIMNVYKELGLYDKKIYERAFKPLFKICKLDINITLKEFYEKTQKELVIFTTNYRTFEPKGFSYKNEPDMLLMDAIYMSSTLPFFKPLKRNEDYFIDGVYSCRYPLNHFIRDNSGVDLNDIFGIYMINNKEEIIYTKDPLNVFSFNSKIIVKLLRKINNNETEDIKIANSLSLLTNKESSNIFSFINKKNIRQIYFNEGYEQAGVYLLNKNN